MNILGEIEVERERQINKEKYTADHDDNYNRRGQLAAAAECYCENNWFGWPWPMAMWRPKDRRRNLIRAGALLRAQQAYCERQIMRIVKEVEELDGISEPEKPKRPESE